MTHSKRIMIAMTSGKISMMKRNQFLTVAAAAFGAVLALSACATEQPIAGPVPQVGFSHLSPITFKVARVEVDSAYKSLMQAPNAEQRMPTQPERAMLDWALARLKAGGAAGPAVAKFVVEDAAVIETKLTKTKGFKGLLTYEPAERYDARAAASLTVENAATGSSGVVQVTATRSIEVRENATLAEREQAWVELVENLMADFNTQMEIQIRTHLTDWIAR